MNIGMLIVFNIFPFPPPPSTPPRAYLNLTKKLTDKCCLFFTYMTYMYVTGQLGVIFSSFFKLQ